MQTRGISAIEAAANTLVGYVISVALGQLVVYPMFGVELTLMDNAGITALFVAASYLRAYIFRRLFSKWLNQVLVRWTSKLSKKWLNFTSRLKS